MTKLVRLERAIEKEISRLPDLPDLILQILLHPERRIPYSSLTKIETECIKLMDKGIYIEPEYFRTETQYGNKMLHIEEGRKPHFVLRGKLPLTVYIRTGDGRKEIVEAKKLFKTHILVDLYN